MPHVIAMPYVLLAIGTCSRFPTTRPFPTVPQPAGSSVLDIVSPVLGISLLSALARRLVCTGLDQHFGKPALRNFRNSGVLVHSLTPHDSHEN